MMTKKKDCISKRKHRDKFHDFFHLHHMRLRKFAWCKPEALECGLAGLKICWVRFHSLLKNWLNLLFIALKYYWILAKKVHRWQLSSVPSMINLRTLNLLLVSAQICRLLILRLLLLLGIFRYYSVYSVLQTTEVWIFEKSYKVRRKIKEKRVG